MVEGPVQGHLAWCLPPNSNSIVFQTNDGTSYYHCYVCE